MANSYINIVTFILTTVFYYLALKPSLSYDDLFNKSEGFLGILFVVI